MQKPKYTVGVVFIGPLKPADADGYYRFLHNFIAALKSTGCQLDLIGLVDPETLIPDNDNAPFYLKLNRQLPSRFKAVQGRMDANTRRFFSTEILSALNERRTKVPWHSLVLFNHGLQLYAPAGNGIRRIIVPIDAPFELTHKLPKNASFRYRIGAFFRRWETKRSLSNYAGFDNVIVVSEIDRQHIVESVKPAEVTTIPISVDTSKFLPLQESPEISPKRVVFFGVLDFEPNIRAVDSLLRIFRSRNTTQAIPLLIIGRRPSAKLRQVLKEHNAELREEVPSIRDELKYGDVFVAPMGSGLGMKNKVIEAMSMGLPVVGTPLAFNGLVPADGTWDQSLNEDEIFGLTVNLMQSPALYSQRSQLGHKYVERFYSIPAVTERIRSVVVGGIQSS